MTDAGTRGPAHRQVLTRRGRRLLVVDVQGCFLPGGALPVKGGDEIVPLVNRLARELPHVVLTQDWRTAGHVSGPASTATRRSTRRMAARRRGSPVTFANEG